MPGNSRLKNNVLEALRALFADVSVPPRVTYLDLQDIREEIDIMIEALLAQRVKMDE